MPCLFGDTRSSARIPPHDRAANDSARFGLRPALRRGRVGCPLAAKRRGIADREGRANRAVDRALRTRATIRMLAVEQDGRFVAALPLIGGRLKRLLPIGRLPWNDWSWAGDLLLDTRCDPDAALTLLLAEIARLDWPLIWFNAVPFESVRWRRFISAARSRGMSLHSRANCRIGQIAIDHDWEGYRQSWSKNHRRQMQKMKRRAEREGGAQLRVYRDLHPDDVAPLLQRGFAIEDASWKGAAGSSVLKSSGNFAYYLSQARQLAGWGQLQLTFLEFDGRPIAFEYGWNAKGVYFSPKVGYDQSFGRLTPGQLLRCRLLEQFFANPAQNLVDFAGPLSTATAKWVTTTYPVGRLVLSTGALRGQFVVRRYRDWWPRWKRRVANGPRRSKSPARDLPARRSEVRRSRARRSRARRLQRPPSADTDSVSWNHVAQFAGIRMARVARMKGVGSRFRRSNDLECGPASGRNRLPTPLARVEFKPCFRSNSATKRFRAIRRRSKKGSHVLFSSPLAFSAAG